MSEQVQVEDGAAGAEEKHFLLETAAPGPGPRRDDSGQCVTKNDYSH